jgi:collagenase-like PrtC family protease
MLIEALEGLWRRKTNFAAIDGTTSADFDEEDDSEDWDGAELGVTEPMQLTAMVRTPEQFEAAADLGVKTIYIHNLFERLPNTADSPELDTNEKWLNNWVGLSEKFGEVKVIPYLGRFIYSERLEQYLNQLEALKHIFDTVLVSTIGQLEMAKQKGFDIVSDFSLNVFNQETSHLLFGMGVKQATLSVELNEEQIEHIVRTKSTHDTFEIMGYGKMPVMVNQYCPINGVYSKSKEGCQICRKDQYYLEDKTGARFLVKGDAHCQVEIFNSAVLNLADEWHVLEGFGIQSYRLNFVDENSQEVSEVVETHIKSALDFPIELRGKGYTKGHFKRGVL